MKEDYYAQKAAELVDEVIARFGTNYSQLAGKIERGDRVLSRQSFFKMAKSGTMRLSVFLQIIDLLGLELVVRSK